MQQWIRKFCLQYGAALFYTSAKEDKNCDLLYKYLTHRIYGFPFRTPALVVEKDAVFIPSGWDNMNKIRILYENLHTCKPDDYFRDIIVQPTTRKTINRETELLAEDEQNFLGRQQQILFAGGNNLPGPRLGESPIRSTPLGKATVRTSTQGSPKKVNSFFQIFQLWHMFLLISFLVTAAYPYMFGWFGLTTNSVTITPRDAPKIGERNLKTITITHCASVCLVLCVISFRFFVEVVFLARHFFNVRVGAELTWTCSSWTVRRS
jgi:hypothetical protein